MMAERTGNRLEAFSDGVIAVIVTIMVLELKVPHADGLIGLRSVLPHLGIYLLSFLTVAIYWVNHHELCRRVHGITYGVLWANLGWLFVLSLVPYFTEYIAEKRYDPFSTAVYSAVLACVGAAYGVLRLAIVELQKRSKTYVEADQAEVRKHFWSWAFYIAAFVLAFWRPMVSLALDLVVTLLWIVPSFGTGVDCELVEHSHTATR